MTIAVDFDGTIVEHKYPNIGKPLPFAFETLKALAEEGHLLILWTSRSGETLQEAIDFCSKKGLEFYAVNKNYPKEDYDYKISRKIVADIYIDDRNFNGFPGWGIIGQTLLKNDYNINKKYKKSIFRKRT